MSLDLPYHGCESTGRSIGLSLREYDYLYSLEYSESAIAKACHGFKGFVCM